MPEAPPSPSFTTIRAALAAMVLGLAAPCAADENQSAQRLVIYSPHSEAIRREFTRAFVEDYRDRTGRDVTIDWPDAGGASGILRQIQDKYQHGIHDVDLVFGGGAIHEQMKRNGLLAPCRLPDELLGKLPATVAGEPLYDPEFHWYGAAVSSFGIVYNRKLIAERGLPEIREWSDLARPQFRGLVGMVDAAQSGSVRKAYDIILQAYGYERGMGILMLMGANARGIGRSSSEIPRECAQGFVAAGACIDFYAWRQMTSPGGDDLGFVLPKGLTVINTDPIGILRDAPHRDLAEQFLAFVMSPRGQMLWSLRKGTPGGPRDETLGRYAVLPEVYAEQADYLVPGLTDPLDAPPNEFYSQQKENARIEILPAYLRAMMITNKRLLSDAWKAVIKVGAPPTLVSELAAPLVSEEEMLRLAREVWRPVVINEETSTEEKARLRAEQDRRNRLRSDTELAWSEAFRARYKAVAEKARELRRRRREAEQD